MINRKKFLKLASANTAGIILLDKFSLNAFPFYNYSHKNLEIINNIERETPDPLNENLYDAVKGYKIIQNDDPNNILIIVYELTNDIIDYLPKERNVAIFCYKASFKDRSVINLDGKNLFLLSNEINFRNTTISTQPEIAQDANPIQQAELDGLIRDRKNIPAPAGEDIAIDKTSEQKNNNAINGRNGGDITINCLAADGNVNLVTKGAKGGKGQMGANGRNGADDKKLEDIIFFDPVKRPTEGSINGFPGEIGGTGALGGFGGNGGNLNLLIPSKTTSIISDISGGLQGESGEAGNSGNGGIGLDHSITSFQVTGFRDHERNPVAVYDNSDIPSVGKNVPGTKLPDTQKRNGQSGEISLTSNEEFYKYIPVEFGKLLLLKAESLYLNSSFAENDSNLNEAYELLSFVYKMSINNPGSVFSVVGVPETNSFSSFGAGDGPSFLQSSLFYLSYYKSDPKQWNSIKQKCSSYINQIRLNLDFFGNPPNYAPELAYDFLAANFLDNYPLIKDFGDSAKKITDQKRGLQKEIFTAFNYIKQCDYNIDDLNSKIEKFKKSIIDLNSDLQNRFAIIENLKIKLQGDETDLQKAIDDIGGCTFGIVLKCLTAIAAIVAAVYTCGAATSAAAVAVGSVVSGLEAVNSLAELKTALENQNSVIKQGSKNVANQMDVVLDDIDTVKKNVKLIQDAFNEKNAPNVAIPDFLINVDTSKFDATIDKIIDDPNLSDQAKSRAARYKSDYHYFVDYIKVTNQKRLDITSDVLGISQAYHEKELQQQQKGRYDEAIINDTVLLSSKQDLFEMYYKIMLHASYLIYLQNKALSYQYPEKWGIGEDNQFDQLDLNQLSAVAFNNNWSYILNFNDPKSSIRAPKSTLSPLIIEIINHDASNLKINKKGTNYVSNLSLQDFRIPLKDENQDTYFSFHFDIVPTRLNSRYIFFEGYNIKVRGIIVFLKSREKEYSELRFKLTHLGNSIVTKDKDLNQIQFFEVPRTTVLYSDVSPKKQGRPTFEKVLGDSSYPERNLIDGTSAGDFAQMGRSPFASWKLDIPMSYNTLSEQGLKELISDLTSIELYFYYTYQQG